MGENRAKRKLHNGELVTVIAGFNTPDVIDFLGPLGFDAAWLEGEHGPVTWDDVGNLSRACDLWGMSSIVRIHSKEPGLFTRYLDQGVNGIVVPHVNTREEALRVVQSAKFTPLGNRGIYGGRQAYGRSDFFQKANDETIVVVMIEEMRGIKALDEILTVDNVDVFLVAPGDLAQSMGYLGQPDHPEVRRVLDDAIRRIARAGKAPGATVNEANLQHYIDLGAKFFHTNWPSWVNSGGKRFLELTRKKP